MKFCAWETWIYSVQKKKMTKSWVKIETLIRKQKKMVKYIPLWKSCCKFCVWGLQELLNLWICPPFLSSKQNQSLRKKKTWIWCYTWCLWISQENIHPTKKNSKENLVKYGRRTKNCRDEKKLLPFSWCSSRSSWI